MSSTLKGGCLCGAVRFAVSDQPKMVALCHCSMCRRSTGAPAVAWAMFADKAVTISGPVKHYASSPGVARGHCDQCGTSISFTADFLPGLIDLTVASFDDPSLLPPTLQYWYSRRLPWFRRDEELPHFAELPPLPA